MLARVGMEIMMAKVDVRCGPEIDADNAIWKEHDRSG